MPAEALAASPVAASALVFELGFARLRASRRHRSGVVLVGARVLRWLADAPPGDAHCLDELVAAATGLQE